MPSPFSTSRSAPSVETITSGIDACFSLDFMNEASSRPLMSGMLMSVTTRSKLSRGSRRSASKPLFASMILTGTTSSSRLAAMRDLIVAESSTIRMRFHERLPARGSPGAAIRLRISAIERQA
jgi:hypothetical protein